MSGYHFRIILNVSRIIQHHTFGIKKKQQQIRHSVSPLGVCTCLNYVTQCSRAAFARTLISGPEMAYVMPGIKRVCVLVYQGYRYQKYILAQNSINWRCWRKHVVQPYRRILVPRTLPVPINFLYTANRQIKFIYLYIFFHS